MSKALLTRVKEHLDAGNLLTGYAVKYFRYSDADTNERGEFVLLRPAGTSGESDFIVQTPDVQIVLVAQPEGILTGDAKMLEILRYLRNNFDSASVLGFEPIGPVIGPRYLENGRPVFELNVRCTVLDH